MMRLPENMERYAVGRDVWGVASLLVATGASLANIAREEGLYHPNPWIGPIYLTSSLRIMNSMWLGDEAGSEGEMARRMCRVDNLVGTYALFGVATEVADFVARGLEILAQDTPEVVLAMFAALADVTEFGEVVLQQPTVAFGLVAASLLLTYAVDKETVRVK